MDSGERVVTDYPIRRYCTSWSDKLVATDEDTAEPEPEIGSKGATANLSTRLVERDVRTRKCYHPLFKELEAIQRAPLDDVSIEYKITSWSGLVHKRGRPGYKSDPGDHSEDKWYHIIVYSSKTSTDRQRIQK
jgi:hypothetical protein